jgi:hypothetical protein
MANLSRCVDPLERGSEPPPGTFVAVVQLARMIAIVISVPIVVVVMVVPVALGVPAMPVFIPPAMPVVPTVFARFAQLVPSFVRLLAFASMMLDGVMKMMVRPGDSLLAIVFIGAQTRRAGEEQESRQSRAGQCYFPRTKYSSFFRPKNSRMKFCLHPVLLYV